MLKEAQERTCTTEITYGGDCWGLNGLTDNDKIQTIHQNAMESHFIAKCAKATDKAEIELNSCDNLQIMQFSIYEYHAAE